MILHRQNASSYAGTRSVDVAAGAREKLRHRARAE
jgi:hypothetical protein